MKNGINYANQLGIDIMFFWGAKPQMKQHKLLAKLFGYTALERHFDQSLTPEYYKPMGEFVVHAY